MAFKYKTNLKRHNINNVITPVFPIPNGTDPVRRICPEESGTYVSFSNFFKYDWQAGSFVLKTRERLVPPCFFPVPMGLTKWNGWFTNI